MTSLALARDLAPTLRPYQLDAIAAVRARFAAGDRGSILVMATGLGKTVVFAEIARLTVAKGHRALVLAHRTELLEQAHQKLEAVGVDAAIEQGPRRAGHADVVVASVATLRGARLAAWPADAFDLVIIDECHHATAATYRAIVDHFARARILGVTATPDRADGQGLGPIFQSVAFEYALPAAIRDGWLAPITARRIKLDVDLDRVKTKAGDLDQQQLAAAMTDPAVIEATVRGLLENIGDRPTVVFTANVAHALLLAAACNDLRPGSARAVSGDSDELARATVGPDLASRRVQIVANCALLTEGWDCLDSETEILTAAGWRGMGQVRAGDRVQSMNLETEAIEEVEATRYVERRLKPGERMFSIESQHVNIRTTEGHQFHIKARTARGLSTFKTLSGADLAGRRSPYAIPLAAAGDFPDLPISDDELRFIAWFMTDGGFERSDVTIAQSKEHKDDIRELLRRLGYDFKERVRKPRKGCYPNAKPLHVFRVPRGTHHASLKRSGWHRLAAYLDKNVSRDLRTMSRRQFIVFWEELLKGDGDRAWLWCNRREQADAYTAMATLRGLSSSFSTRTLESGSMMFAVSVRDRQWLISDPADVRAARLSLEEPRAGEWVWCVTNKNATLVTRRRGKIAIIGNCPDVACVAIARPTKSRALFTQCVGRGTRLAEGKRDLLVLDFAGLTRRHKLVCTVDVLAGTGLTDEEKDHVTERMNDGDDFEAALASARAAIAQARMRPTLRWLAEEVTDLLGEVDPALLGEGFAPATDVMLQLLADKGIKAPAGLTDLAGAKLLALCDQRRRAGLCSVKQVRFLATLHVPRDAAKDFTFNEAAFAIARLRPLLAERWSLPGAARKVLAAIEFNRRPSEPVDEPDALPLERNNWKRHR